MKEIENLEPLQWSKTNDPEFFAKYVETIKQAISKNANGNTELMQARLKNLDKELLDHYTLLKNENVDLVLDNPKEIKEILHNIHKEFVWNSNFVIKGITKDNLQDVLIASRKVKAGDADAINYLHYVQYSSTKHNITYSDVKTDVDSKIILDLLTGRHSINPNFDSELSSLFTSKVNMSEKKAYGKSFTGIIEQRPELLDIVSQTKKMSPQEYDNFINNLIKDGKLPERLTFNKFSPDNMSVEADTAVGAFEYMKKHKLRTENS